MATNGSSDSSSTSRQRRQSQSTLAAMDVPRSRTSPGAILGAIFKHGKYVALGAAGIWWLDLADIMRALLASSDGWGR